MYVIGHRGAKGRELENTQPSIARALHDGADAVEFDLRLTKDKQLVLCHDADLSAVSSDNRKIKDLTKAELQKITLKNGSVPIFFEDALKLTGKSPLYAELKDSGSAEILVQKMPLKDRERTAVLSFKHEELVRVKELVPGARTYLAHHHNPFEVVQTARKYGFTGVCINFWLLNPLTYFAAKRFGLTLYVYAVNSLLLGKFLLTFYPDIDICTDYPDYFRGHPKRSKSSRYA
jgi:glycerophosphoryl diester phosphodiesterase